VIRWLIQHPEYTQSDLKFEDLGKSGYHGDHIKDGGGWAKLLLAVEQGAIQPGDVVLVEAIDRTGRLPALDMLGKVIAPILQAGISIITLDDNTTYTNESAGGPQIFLLIAKIQAAHGYSKQLSERTKASYDIRRERAKKGEPVMRWTPAWLTVDGHVKDHVASHVRQVFELYVSGVGKNAIANRLRGTGVVELAKCSGPTVEGWLRNKAAIGYWNDIPNVYPAIVTPELFMQAQQRQKQVATKPPERTSKHFLVGLVKCGVCGANLIIHNKDGKPNNMRCITHHRLKDRGCANADTIPYQVVAYVYSITALGWVEKAFQTIQLTVDDKRKLELTTEREAVTAFILRLTKLLATVDDDEVHAELLVHSARRKVIDDELAILDRSPVLNGSVFTSALAADQMMIRDAIQLSSLLKQAGYTITIYPEKLLKVADELFPWKYLGPKRKLKSNETLGYRVLYLGDEMLISPELPETPNWGEPTDNPIEQVRYLLRRGHKLISAPRPFDYVEAPDCEK
jgi:DNA invertase Pin-like site-specific DNA recombinase